MAENILDTHKLSFDEAIVAFTIYMQIEVSLDELCDWFDLAAKGLKARPKISKETLQLVLSRLTSSGYITTSLFLYSVDKSKVGTIAPSIAKKFPNEISAIAKTIISSLKSYYSFLNPKKQVTLGQQRSAIELTAWANRLLFANNFESYSLLLYNTYSLLPPSTDMTADEYRCMASGMLLACSDEMLDQFDHRFITLKHAFIDDREEPEDNEVDSLSDLEQLIETSIPSTRDEVILTHIAIARLHEFPADVSLFEHLPSVAATVSLLRGNDSDAEFYFDEMPPTESLVGVGHVLREILYLQEDILNLNALATNMRAFSESPQKI